MAVWFVVGAALAVALAIAYLRPGFAQSILSSWTSYKNALFLGVGAVMTWYLLTSGVWYLMLFGAVGVVLAAWALVLGDPLKPVFKFVGVR